MALLYTTYGAVFQVFYQSAVSLGLKAGGNVLSSAEFLDPGNYINIGFKAAEPLWDKIRLGNVISSEPIGIAYFFAWCAVIVAYICLAFSILMAQVEVSVALIATAVMLPFSLWHPTSWMARGTIAYPVNKFFRFFLLALFASALFPIIKYELTFVASARRTLWQVLTTMLPTPTESLAQATVLIIATWLMALLYMRTSGIASSFMSGRPALTGGMAMGQAIGAATAGAIITTGVVAGGLIAAGGAGGVVGAPAAASGAGRSFGGAGLSHAGNAISRGLMMGSRNLLTHD